MKDLRKDYDVVAKRFNTAKKATDDNLRSAATSQDKETLAKIQNFKQEYERLMKKQNVSKQTQSQQAKLPARLFTTVESAGTFESEAPLLSPTFQVKVETRSQVQVESRRSNLEQTGGINADLLDEPVIDGAVKKKPAMLAYSNQEAILRSEVVLKSKLLKKLKLESEQMQVDHGRKIAQIFDSSDMKEVQMRGSLTEAAFLQEELGDLQFMQMQDDVSEDNYETGEINLNVPSSSG